LLVGVAAGVGLLGAVQAQVDEAGGHLLGGRPTGAVREDDGDVVPPAEAHERLAEEALVTRFDRVPKLPLAARRGPGPPVQPMIVTLCDPRRLGRVPRQGREELFDPLFVEAESW